MTQQKIMTKPSGIDVSIPYIISPRSTFLDTCQPKLKWNKVEGATSYTVKIATDSEVIWEKEVEETEYHSPEDLPLEVGKIYRLIVESDNGRCSETDTEPSKLEFQLLDEDKIGTLPDDEKKITDSKLSDDEKALELAHLYFGKKYGLVAKATEILEEKIAAGSQNSEIYVTHGNVCLAVGLCSFAEAQYKKALEKIQPDKELEEQIIAKAGLAQICNLKGDEKEAERLMKERESKLKALAKKKARLECDCRDDLGRRGKEIFSICRSLVCIPG